MKAALNNAGPHLMVGAGCCYPVLLSKVELHIMSRTQLGTEPRNFMGQSHVSSHQLQPLVAPQPSQT